MVWSLRANSKFYYKLLLDFSYTTEKKGITKALGELGHGQKISKMYNLIKSLVQKISLKKISK